MSDDTQDIVRYGVIGGIIALVVGGAAVGVYFYFFASVPGVVRPPTSATSTQQLTATQTLIQNTTVSANTSSTSPEVSSSVVNTDIQNTSAPTQGNLTPAQQQQLVASTSAPH